MNPIKSLFAVSWRCSAAASPANLTPAKPNILLIMTDEHHAGVMGCAGDALARTPNLDQLAPGELLNLAAKPDYQERMSAMHAAMVKELGEDPEQPEARWRAGAIPEQPRSLEP